MSLIRGSWYDCLACLAYWKPKKRTVTSARNVRKRPSIPAGIRDLRPGL
jgi:hypothetical protein